MAGYFLAAADAPRSWPDAFVTLGWIGLLALLVYLALRDW
jgi:hypothetical protein